MNAADEEPDFAADEPLDDGASRIVQRPDGYYWVASEERQEFGPFASVEEALAEMEPEEDADAVDALADAEREFGIADWIDPDTGEPAEGRSTRIEDH